MVMVVTQTVIWVLQGVIGFNKNQKTKQKQSTHWTFIPLKSGDHWLPILNVLYMTNILLNKSTLQGN